jgi:hypothetical protein
MKKIFTLSMLLAVTLCASAQQTYRKSWDFTKWSARTVENLKAESAKGPSTGAWSDVEKKDATEPTAASKDNCFWEVTHQGTSEGATIQANGEPIAELEGLLYTNTTDRSLAIAVDYPGPDPSSSFGPYKGASYLWFGGSKKNYFVIPHVAPGTVIKMGVESHKVTDARGVNLYIGFGTSGTQLLDPQGNSVAAPTAYTDQEWLVPTDAPDTPNDDGTYDIQIYNTNGCHIYYIIVGDGDSPQVEDAKKIGYLFNANNADDYAYAFISGDSRFAVTDIDVAAAIPSAEELQAFDAIVISPTIAADNACLPVIKQVIAYVPVLNLNPNLYEALGYGKAVKTDVNVLTIKDPSNAAFEGLDIESGLELLNEGGITGVELGDYFANDAVLATAGDVVAMHMHNKTRNAYMLLPLTLEDMLVASESAIVNLPVQALAAVAATKNNVINVSTPIIRQEKLDGQTMVTISAANSTDIYYTTDGSTPTRESNRYTVPFAVTSPVTVKAFGVGDGYLDSEIAEAQVTIATKAATPVINVAREAGKSVVTLSGATEGTTVYYSFRSTTTETESKIYSEPVEITTPTTIYAFASGGDYLTSDMTSKFVGVDGIDNTNIRWDVVAHFDANADDWKGKGQQTNDAGEIINANYFFTWGKNAGTYYNTESVKEIIKTEEGNDSTIYNAFEPETYEANGWILKSIGQVMTWESLNLGYNIGDTSMRNPDSVEDMVGVNDSIGITPNAVTFGKQPSDGPFNASLETTAKYQAPFDVIVYAGNGNDGQIPTMQIEVSADGENWTKLGDVDYSLIKRNWKRTKLSYEGADEVFVRILHTAAKSSGQIYDIYVMNNGAYSATYSEQGLDGIATVQPAGNIVRTEIFSANGTQVSSMSRGINIIRRTFANGAVKTYKVIVK